MKSITWLSPDLNSEHFQSGSIDKKHLIKLLLTGLKICISIFLIYILIRNIKWQMIHSVISKVNWYFVFALIPLSICGQIISAIKWWYITRTFYPKTKPGVYIELYFIGSFINRFLPSTVGGDMGRVGLLSWKEDIPVSRSSISVIIERVTGFTVLLFLACIGAMIFLSKTYNSIVILWAICCFTGSIFLLIFFFTPLFGNAVRLPFIRRFSGIFQQLEPYHGNYMVLAGSLLLSLCFYLIELITHWALFFQFGFQIPFIKLLAILPVIYFVVNLPISINGIGIRGNSYIFFFGFLAIPSEISIFVSFIIFFYTIVQGLLGGILLIKLFMFQKKNTGKYKLFSNGINFFEKISKR